MGCVCTSTATATSTSTTAATSTTRTTTLFEGFTAVQQQQVKDDDEQRVGHKSDIDEDSRPTSSTSPQPTKVIESTLYAALTSVPAMNNERVPVSSTTQTTTPQEHTDDSNNDTSSRHRRQLKRKQVLSWLDGEEYQLLKMPLPSNNNNNNNNN
eukprot:PhM_4_TR2460/c0_g2_i1/m.15277